ncbi:MAG: CoB--CoM heterodisulfide reductase iron-sulfur subunit B family protein [Clostridia bacterium]|nr:CoB--CoM heterodisulfide reductase iron-sulfur subunit B family protein [Clostridia bacterium]
MKISYYPGCTLRTKAKELDDTARLCAKVLGVEMEEVENWQCCGGVYKTATDEIATKLSAVRALDYAKHHGGKLLTLCSACHNVIKRTNADMKADGDICMRANNYLQLDEPYKGETEVLHYLELLKNVVGFDAIKKAVVKPLNRKIGAYYGCLLLRPSAAMAFDNPENPTIIEDFIRAIGGTPVVYPFRNECCGAYVSLKNGELPKEKSRKVLNSAKEKGAEEVITACPLCLYNLQVNGGEILPVKYFTELLAEALGVKE